MGKICFILNNAPIYREAIYLAIENNWDCIWEIGINASTVKRMSLSRFKNCVSKKRISILGILFWQRGIFKHISNKQISAYIVTGTPYYLSSWVLALTVRIFHPQKKLFFWTHGWYGKESRSTRIIKKAFFKLAHGLFLYGDYAKKLMEKEGFNENKLFVIHNSLDHCEQLKLRATCKESTIYSDKFKNNDPVLLFIGRLTAIKKLDQLIMALDLLNQRGANTNLVFVGDGQEREKLQQLTAELGLENRVWFYGECYDDRQNAELIYNATICVAPGNVGLTAIHSMVFGTPVISHSDFPWQMPEFEAIIPDETGDFFERDNVESLVEAVERWFANHPNRDYVRTKCYQEIDSNWTPEFQIDILKKAFEVTKVKH